MGRLKTLGPRIATQCGRIKVAEPGSWRQGKTSAQRGYGYRWQQARARFLTRHPLCVMCEQQDRVTAATVVDHVIPHRGDDRLMWDERNWQALCSTHHSRDKQRAEQGE